MTGEQLRPWVRGAVAFLVTVTLMLVAGWQGALAGGLLFAAWWLTPPPFPFVVAQSGIVATIGINITPPLLVAEAGALGLLGVPIVLGHPSRAGIQAGFLSGVLFLGTLLWLQSSLTVMATGIALAGGAGLGLYGLHRYERVKLGHVSATEP